MKQKIDIPEGCQATIDHDNRVVVIESKKEEPKFKRGDIVTTVHPTKGKWIFAYETKSGDDYFYLACYESQHEELIFDCYCYNPTGSFYMSTESEQQRLFDALAKEGKKWNPDTLEIEDIEQRILVPESIGVYRLDDDCLTDHEKGDSLYIAFNKDKQLLGYLDNQYVVDVVYKDWYEKVQCELIPCKREDLKAGDTAVGQYKDRPIEPGFLCKILDLKKVVYMLSDCTKVDEWTNENLNWYKLIPIN